MGSNENLQNMSQELRRGLIMLAVLSQLNRKQYGYALLNPLLRRLEGQGLLASSWNVDEARPRRYYVISSEGRKLLPQLRREWESMVAAMGRLLKS